MSQTFGDWDATASNNTTVGASAINIAEGCPPGNVNDALREIMAAAVRSWGGMHAGTSRPAGVQPGRFWLDTTSATAPVLKWYDGTDDIPFMTIDYSANTITLSSSVIASIADGSITTAKLADNAVTLAKLQDIATASFLGRTTAEAGDPEILTGTQATALLDVFTSTTKGLAPASGGGTTNFLRADGTWAAPPAGASGAMTFLSSTDLSSATSWDFTGFDSSQYDSYLITLGNVDTSSTADNLQIYYSTNGGDTWTGAEKVAGIFYASDQASSNVFNGSPQLTPIDSDGGGDAGIDKFVSGEIRILMPHIAESTLFTAKLVHLGFSDEVIVTEAAGRFTTTSAVNGVRLKFSVGNMASGTITVYGLRNA